MPVFCRWLTLVGRLFVEAYEKASMFTLPVVVSRRMHTGEVECDVGAAIVLNADGWLVTALHMLEPLRAHAEHREAIAEYDAEAQRIAAGPGNETGKQKRLRALSAGRTLIRNVSYWWGIDGWSVSEWQVLPEADLALGKIDRFDAARVGDYPVFRDSADMRPGASVCRLGFPFHTIGATYDSVTNSFTLAPGSLPVPRFPNEGIVTRFVDMGVASDGTGVRLIETSSPGLRGQSGGPIVDVDGRVWAMQSRTAHLPLGFSPEVEIAGRKVTEHQFLNVGLGVHGETIVAFAAKHGVTLPVR